MHEDYDYYMDCKYRNRNKGLFTADQVIKDQWLTVPLSTQEYIYNQEQKCWDILICRSEVFELRSVLPFFVNSHLHSPSQCANGLWHCYHMVKTVEREER